MSQQTLEERVAALEQKMERVESALPAPPTGKKNWLSAVLGRFKGDADFDEIARAGAEIRATGRLPNEPAPDESNP